MSEPAEAVRRRGRAASLTPYPDGPAVVRGPFALVDDAGAELRTHRRAVALCRCGRSRLGAICDGTHRSAGFRAPGEPAREVGPVVRVPLAGSTPSGSSPPGGPTVGSGPTPRPATERRHRFRS